MTLTLINPFIPHHPIDSKLFVGREDELRRLEAALQHTKRKKPINFMITGERGIGKTSLLNYVQAMARSYSDSAEQQLNFVVVCVQIEGSTTQVEFVRKIEVALRHELDRVDSVHTFLDKVWAFAQRLEVAGVSIKDGAQAKVLWEEFANSLIQTVVRICTPPSGLDSTDAAYDGLLILIDEVDTVGEQFEIGAFLKYLTEYFQRHACKMILIGLSGLPKMVDVLLQNHRSALRVFEEMRLAPLTNNEVVRLIEQFLETAEEENGCLFQMSPEAVAFLVEISDGHPHFIQQHCYCAFNAFSGRLSEPEILAARQSYSRLQSGLRRPQEHLNASTLVIEYADVLQGSFASRGAIDLIGDMYFSDLLSSGVEDSSVMNVLNFVAQVPSQNVARESVVSTTCLEEGIAHGALSELVKRGVLIRRREDDSYRLRYRCFAYWLQKSGFGSQVQL